VAKERSHPTFLFAIYVPDRNNLRAIPKDGLSGRCSTATGKLMFFSFLQKEKENDIKIKCY